MTCFHLLGTKTFDLDRLAGSQVLDQNLNLRDRSQMDVESVIFRRLHQEVRSEQ